MAFSSKKHSMLIPVLLGFCINSLAFDWLDHYGKKEYEFKLKQTNAREMFSRAALEEVYEYFMLEKYKTLVIGSASLAVSILSIIFAKKLYKNYTQKKEHRSSVKTAAYIGAVGILGLLSTLATFLTGTAAVYGPIYLKAQALAKEALRAK